MKKVIYYYQKEVKIGDLIELNGVMVTLTEQLIKDLPNRFKVKDVSEIPKMGMKKILSSKKNRKIF